MRVFVRRVIELEHLYYGQASYINNRVGYYLGQPGGHFSAMVVITYAALLAQAIEVADLNVGMN